MSSFRVGRSHHYIPQDTSVFGTEGNISCYKVNIWSQLCVCVNMNDNAWGTGSVGGLQWLDTPSAFEAWTNRWGSGSITEVLLKGTWPRIHRDGSPSEAFHECVLQPTILDAGNKKLKCVWETLLHFFKRFLMSVRKWVVRAVLYIIN